MARIHDLVFHSLCCLCIPSRPSDEADDILTHGAKRFPTAAMLLIRAHYNFAYRQNHGMALNLLSRAEQRSPSLEDKFTIYYYRKMNEESFTSGDANTEVLAYLTFQHTLNEARKQDEAASKWQNMFWEELLKPQTDVGRLGELAEALNESMMLVRFRFSFVLVYCHLSLHL